MKRILGAIAFVLLGIVFFSIGIAAAHDDLGSRAWYRTEFQTANRCWHVQPDLRHPGSGASFDFNVTTRSYQGATYSACTGQTSPYSRPPSYLGVRGWLIKDGSSICASFSWNYNGNTTHSFATGAPTNACGTGGYWVEGQAYSLWNGVAKTSPIVTNLCCEHDL